MMALGKLTQMSEKEGPGRGGGTAGGRAGSGRGQGERRPVGARREKQEWIGRQLRSVYNQVLDEPLPDELKTLLSKLDGKAKGGS